MSNPKRGPSAATTMTEKLPETITIAGATLTRQETDDAAERPMYCDNDSCVWLGRAKHGDEPMWQADFVIGAAHFVVVDAETLGDVLVQLEEMVAETRTALARTQPGQTGEVWTQLRDAVAALVADETIARGPRLAAHINRLSALLDAETKGGGK